MKKLMFSAALATAALATASCNKDLAHESGLAEAKYCGDSVVLTVGVSSGGTKVTGVSETLEKTVESLQVFIFGENGGLEKYGSAAGVQTMELNCFAGAKDVVALVNGPEIDWLSVGSREDLDSKVSILTEDNSYGRFLMYGSKSDTVSEDKTITVDVSRRVARVVIDKITNDVASNASVGELYVNAIYLINAAGSTTYLDDPSYSPTTWYNKSGWDNEAASLLYDSFTSARVAYGDSYQTAHYFYCYPNPTAEDSNDSATGSSWVPRLTRLVVEATLNGHKWYYPVTIEGLEANCSYEITNLTITGAGSDTPDNEPSNYEYTFTVNVVDWDRTYTQESI